jgi:predicted GIY-YIG superfamily endonuclease
MKGHIYKIVNTVNDKYYLGSSNNITRRWRDHVRNLDNNKHCNTKLQNAWNKYGKDSFVFEVIYESENIKEDEQKELDKIDFTVVYNIATTSNGGCGNIINHPDRENIYKRMGLAQRGKPPTNNIKISIEGKVYNSYHDANKNLSIPICTIRYRCLSSNILYKNWYKLDQPKIDNQLYKAGDKQGHTIMCEGVEYPSYNEAARAYNMTDTSVRYRVKSKNYPDFYIKDTALTTIEKQSEND